MRKRMVAEFSFGRISTVARYGCVPLFRYTAVRVDGPEGHFVVKGGGIQISVHQILNFIHALLAQNLA